MEKFIETAASRETSREIMEAILYVAGNDEAGAVRIWEDPSEAQMIAIWERATKNGLIPAEELVWGAEGSAWAKTIQAKKTYITDSGEDKVVIYANGTFETFTRGTSNALYRGDDVEAARKSLELSEDDWAGLLLSDAEEE